MIHFPLILKVGTQRQKGNKSRGCFFLFWTFVFRLLFIAMAEEEKWICPGCDTKITNKSNNIQKHIYHCTFYPNATRKLILQQPQSPDKPRVQDGYSLVSNKWILNLFQSFAICRPGITNEMLFQKNIFSSSNAACGGQD